MSAFADGIATVPWLLGGIRPSDYEPDAVLEVHLPNADETLTGNDAIAGYLASRWPAHTRAEALSVRDTEGGSQLRVEIVFDDGTVVRERHLIHGGGAIGLHVIYPERVPVTVGDEALTAGGIVAENAASKTALPPGFTGAPIEKIVTHDGSSVIVKHLAPPWSWVMRATHDEGREASIWADGRRPPSGIDIAVIETVRLTDRWLLYMNDVGDEVAAMGSLSRADEVGLLRRLATMAGDVEPHDDLCRLEDRLSLFAPATAQAERGSSDLAPKITARGWELIRDLIPSDLYEVATSLAGEPAKLARALASEPSGLIHGDLRPGNLGIRKNELVLIDWGLATWAPPALDLVWYLFNRKWSDGLDAGLTAVADALGPGHEIALDLSVVATFIQVSPYFGFNAVQEPDPAARAAARRELAAWVDATRRSLGRVAPLMGA